MNEYQRYYQVTLIVTVEQENAIVGLFNQRNWMYIKAGNVALETESSTRAFPLPCLFFSLFLVNMFQYSLPLLSYLKVKFCVIFCCLFWERGVDCLQKMPHFIFDTLKEDLLTLNTFKCI